MANPQKKLRWGILSCANIAQKALIPALLKSEYAIFHGLASRDIDRARGLAATYASPPKVYGDYESLLADPDIDVIYNPTPNHLHLPLSLAALRAGKHVLCEKPIGMNKQEALALRDAAQKNKRLLVREAFMYRLHPQWRKAKLLLDSGEIGPLRQVNTTFCYHNVDPDNVRNKADIGGGALLDIGCYAVSVARWLFNAMPLEVSAEQTADANFSTDIHTRAILRFAEGASNFYCSTQTQRSQFVEILGEAGRILIPVPFNPPVIGSVVIKLEKNTEKSRFEFIDADHYLEQVDEFSKQVLGLKPAEHTLGDAVENMAVIDAIFDSARQHRWIAPSGCPT